MILTARDAAEGEAAAEAAGGGFRPLDVTDLASIAALADGLAADGVTVDVLVNNAAVAFPGFDAEVARRTIDANVHGPLRVTDALLPLIPDGGTVVMVSSGVGELSGMPAPLRQRFAAPDLTRGDVLDLVEAFVESVARDRYREEGWPGSAYRVSKVALNALTRVLAAELAPRRIKVNAVCPGWVRTRMGGAGAPRKVARGRSRSSGRRRCRPTGRPAGSSATGGRSCGEGRGRVRVEPGGRPPPHTGGKTKLMKARASKRESSMP